MEMMVSEDKDRDVNVKRDEIEDVISGNPKTSDHIRKSPFRPAKIPDVEKEEEVTSNTERAKPGQ